VSIRFSGGGSYDITLSPTIACTSKMTLCAWSLQHTPAAIDSDVIWLNNSGGSGAGDSISIGHNSSNVVFYNQVAGSFAAYYSQAAATDVWEHYAYVADGTNAIAYVNGVQVDSRALTLTGRTGSYNFADMGYNTPDFTLQDVQVFQEALTVNEILSVMRARVPRRPNLVGWWPLHGDSPTFDHSGRAQTLTHSGGTTAKATIFPQASYLPVASPTLALRVVSTVTLTATQLETASAKAAANTLAADVQTARDNAAAGLGGAQLGTGGMPAGSASSAAQLETAAVTASANLLAADVQTALMVVAGSVTLTAAGAQAASMTAAALAVAALVETAAETAAAALTSSQLETAVMSAATFAALNADNVQTAAMVAAANLLGADVETASMAAGPPPQLISASILQTAAMTAVAQLLAATVASGGGSGSAGLSGGQVGTAAGTAGAALSAGGVESGASGATALLLASGVEAASGVAVARITAADLVSAFMFGPSSGGGGGKGNATNASRRPHALLLRRATRFR
jgi:hypothetical protein